MKIRLLLVAWLAVLTLTLGALSPQANKELRASKEVRQAMDAYRVAHPNCAYCGRGKIEVHHVLPLSQFPELAADPNNYISLDRPCHQAVAHYNNFKDYNPNVKEVCEKYGKKN